MSPVRNQPPGRNDSASSAGIGVADEQLRSAADDLAVLAGRRPLVRRRRAAGPRCRVSGGRRCWHAVRSGSRRRAGRDDRMLARTVRPIDRDAGRVGALAPGLRGRWPHRPCSWRSSAQSRVPWRSASSSSDARKNGAPAVVVTRCSSTSRAAERRVPLIHRRPSTCRTRTFAAGR